MCCSSFRLHGWFQGRKPSTGKLSCVCFCLCAVLLYAGGLSASVVVASVQLVGRVPDLRVLSLLLLLFSSLYGSVVLTERGKGLVGLVFILFPRELYFPFSAFPFIASSPRGMVCSLSLYLMPPRSTFSGGLQCRLVQQFLVQHQGIGSTISLGGL